MFKKTCLLIIAAASLQATDLAPAQEILAQKAKLDQIKFEEVTNTSQPESTPLLAKLGGATQKKGYGSYMAVPVSQGKQVINGSLCHVAYYSDAIITTVFSGPYYGLQVVSDYNGFVITSNPIYYVDSTLSGIYLRHEYYDCTIITGSTQVLFAK